MQIPIIVVGDTSGRYILGIESQRGNISVVRHVHDLGEMLGTAQSGIARAVLLVTQYEDLTQSMLAALYELDVAVCAVIDPGSNLPFSEIYTIDALADIPDVLQGVRSAVDRLEDYSDSHGGVYDRQPSNSTSEVESHEAELNQAVSEKTEERLGKVLAIWGAQGAPGRTTFAVNLSGLAANAGHKVCLVDADTYGASVGAVLGLTDDYSSLAQMCHFADRGNLDSQKIDELVSTIQHKSHQLDIISGINRPDRWTEIRGKALSRVINMLREKYDVIIIDTSFCIEQDEVAAFDGLAPLRNDGSLTSILEADHILVVGAADVVGVPRTVKALDSLKNLLSDTMIDIPRSVFFNKVRADAVGANPTVAIEHAWERFGPSEKIEGYVSEDRATTDKACLSGKTIMEAAPKSKVGLEFESVFTHISAVLALRPAEDLSDDASNLSSDNVRYKRKLGPLARLWGR